MFHAFILAVFLAAAPAAQIQSVTAGTSGQTVVCWFADAQGNPSNLSALQSSDIQTVNVAAGGGTFTLSSGGQTTQPIPYGAPAAAVQSALQALSSIGSGNVTVTGFGPYVVAFGGTLANSAQPVLTIDSSRLTPQPPAPPNNNPGQASAQFIDDLDPGFTAVGSWGTWRGDKWKDANHVLNPASGTGSQFATWTASGLAPGNYQVQTALWLGGDHAPDAPYRIYDGTTLRAFVRLNMNDQQASAPVTATYNDGAHDWPFTDVAIVYCVSGTLSIVLGDDCKGPYVIADVVRIAPAQAGPLPAAVQVSASVQHTKTGGPPTISVNGGASVPLTQAIWQPGKDNRLPYVVFLLPSVLKPADVVTFSAPDGWAVTDSGPLAVTSSVAVTNSTGQSLLPAVSGTQTMRLGWNTAMPDYVPTILPAANMMRGAGGWSGMDQGTTVLDATGGTVSTATPNDPNSGAGCPITSVGSNVIDPPLGPYGYPNTPTGTYTLLWDGSGNAQLQSGNLTEVKAQANLTGGKDNRRVYTVGMPDPAQDGGRIHYPELSVAAWGQTTNHRVYPPGVATGSPASTADGSVQFGPDYLRMLKGAHCLRAMAPMQTGISNVVNYADFAHPSQRSYSNPVERTVRLAIASVSSYDNAKGFFDKGNLGLLVTTAQPHGFATGQIVSFRGPNHQAMPIPVNNSPDGPTFDLNGWNNLILFYDPASMSPSQFGLGIGRSGTPTVSGTYSGGGTVTMMKGVGQPPEDHVDLCNTVGADCWLNVPQTATDACVTQLAAMVASRLKPGLKVYVELSNEHWNSGFPQAWYFNCMARVQSLPSASQAYAAQAAHVHSLFTAALEAANRVGDLRRVMGSFDRSTGVTQDVLNWCVASKAPVDCIAIAPYYGNGPVNPSTVPQSVLDALTVDQVMDLGELWMVAGMDTRAVAGHVPILKKAYPQATVVCYEAGPGQGNISRGQSPSWPAAKQAQAWHKHPRQRGIVLTYLKQLQDAGCSLTNVYSISGAYGGDGTTYGAYTAWNQPAGLGDGSDGLFDNRTDFYNLAKVVSVVGGAAQAWQASVSGTAPIPSPTPPTPTPTPPTPTPPTPVPVPIPTPTPPTPVPVPTPTPTPTPVPGVQSVTVQGTGLVVRPTGKGEVRITGDNLEIHIDGATVVPAK